MFQLGSRSDVTSSPTQIPLCAVVNIEITYSNACRNARILSIEIIFSLMKSGKLVDFLKRKKIGGVSGTLRNFTEGNSRNLIRIFLFFHLKSNYVIRIGTHQDRYVGMHEFSNHAVLLMSDSTMVVSSKYTQDLSVLIVSFTFSFTVNGFSVSTSGL